MKLPNGNRAIIDPRKLVDYCLSPDHELGKHKAQRFSDILGIGPLNWGRLHDALALAASTGEVIRGDSDTFGTRYRIEQAVENDGKTAMVRSIWIIRTGESDPRLVTCYIL